MSVRGWGVALALAVAGPAAAAPPANVVVLLADDAGYADFSFQGRDGFPTPRIDEIARDGVRFTNGYATASVCSPSRAGLLSGRYQQRFGHEHNLHAHHGRAGLPDDVVLLSDVLARKGYRTIAVGKWHLGGTREQHPLRHGFQHFYGFAKGQRSYLPQADPPELSAMQEADEPVPERFDYLTDELGRRAAAFVDAHEGRPFFLYVAFSAVHVPLEARADVLARTTGVEPEERRVLAAMTSSLDAAVGQVLDALERNGLRDRTLVVFLNDNGGAPANAASNAPLRGHKGTPFEGGLRVPFAMRWPGVLPAGARYDEPVSALDVFPTALAAAGLGTDGLDLDGVDLVPFLTGRAKGAPHEVLFWRRGAKWALREGPWKLVAADGGRPRLYHLPDDPGEARDRAADERERVKRMRQKFARWARSLQPPRWKGSVPAPRAAREADPRRPEPRVVPPDEPERAAP